MSGWKGTTRSPQPTPIVERSSGGSRWGGWGFQKGYFSLCQMAQELLCHKCLIHGGRTEHTNE